jgi:hypothetical protein
VAAEDPDGVRARVKAWRLKNGSGAAFQLVPQAPNLRDPRIETELARTIAEAAFEFDADNIPLGLVILDTLSKVAPGADQNASNDMSALMAALDRLALGAEILILVLAHTPKDEARGIAGWHGQFGAADAVLMLTRDSEDEHRRIATTAKLKNGQDGGKLAFRLEPFQIGVDEDGDPITSCTVVFEDATDLSRRTRAPKLSAPEQIALRAVAHLLDHGEMEPAPPAQGVRPGTLAVRRDEVRARAFADGFADEGTARNTRNVQWTRSIQKLVAAEKIRVSGDLVWLP